ncbi:hypothetical protein LMG26690_00269 [Achromobacter animicus]|uniref:Uncharacterized protein n=2 Tax=Achromobacter animicus TaxID=1389935 RepID=A0A6S6Z5B4_9BURK|nr:hypothetical protein LMG26690_00269 [Achromobacter animicus]
MASTRKSEGKGLRTGNAAAAALLVAAITAAFAAMSPTPGNAAQEKAAAPAAASAAGAAVAAAPAAASPAPITPVANAPAPAAARIAPPDAAAVLYAIHQVDSKGAPSADVANGSIATYWFGHAFELEGTPYYTGFIWETAERYGKPGEDDVGPMTTVNLAEATFIRDPASPESPWKFRGMEPTIGEFGAYERPPEVDTQRKPLEYRTASGKLLLAVPTETFENGITISGYALLVFTPPEKRQDETGNVWSYVGNVIAGEDNGPACADGDVMPCTRSEGELVFSANATADLPRVTVQFSGNTISGPGKTRKLGPGDAVIYAYDATRKQYVAQ